MSTGSLRAIGHGPPGGRMKGQVEWRTVAGGLEQPPSWRGKLGGTEYAGACFADCTCYSTGTTGTL